MKRNYQKMGLAATVAGLLLTGCAIDSDETLLDPNQDTSIPVSIGSYDAQWQVDRTAVDTATFQVLPKETIVVNNVPSGWLTERFMPAEARNGFAGSLPTLQLTYLPVGYSGLNSYFSMQTASQYSAGVPSYSAVTYSSLPLLRIEKKVVDKNINAPTNEYMAAHPDSLFVLDDSYLLTVYFSPTESAGVYDGQLDAWTLTFAIDSVAVDYTAMVGRSNANGQITIENAPQTYRTVDRFSPTIRLNLLTTGRKR